MGFMDKAKKLAEQAQTKLDEVQQQFNSSSGGGQQSGGPVVEYDANGRPIQTSQPAAPPAAPAAPPAPPAAAAPPAAPPSETATPPHGDTLGEAAKRDGDDEPPRMTSGDPLAG